MIFGTGERIEPTLHSNIYDWCVFQRHLYAYSIVNNFIDEEDIVLDFGCGEGYGASFLSKYCKKVIAIDQDIEAISRARKKYSSNNCTFLSLEEYEKLDIQFDLAVSFQVIEHVSNISNYINDILSKLKSSSKLLITTPNRQFRLMSDQQPWNPYHLREYEYEELKMLISEYFDNYEIVGLKGNFYVNLIEKSRIAFLKKDVPKGFKLINKGFHFLSDFKKFPFKWIPNFLKRNITLDQFRIARTEISNSIDFLVICTKE